MERTTHTGKVLFYQKSTTRKPAALVHSAELFPTRRRTYPMARWLGTQYAPDWNENGCLTLGAAASSAAQEQRVVLWNQESGNNNNGSTRCQDVSGVGWLICRGLGGSSLCLGIPRAP